MTPDVSPNVPSNLMETLQDFQKLTYKERAARFKNLNKGEQRLLARVIDTLFTSSLAPVKDEEKQLVDKLTGRVSNGESIKEKPSSRLSAISQRIEEFVAPFFKSRIAPLFAPLGRAFAPLGRAFVSLEEKLGMMNEAILDKKLQDAVDNYRSRINQYKINSNNYVSLVNDLSKELFETLKEAEKISKASGDDLETLQKELDQYLEQLNKLSERIKEIDNLQQDLVITERTLGNELSKSHVDARKGAQAAFESETFETIKSSILTLKENASNEELSGLVRPMLQLKEAYERDHWTRLYTTISNDYVEQVHDLPKKFFETLKKISEVTEEMNGASGDNLEPLQKELDQYLEQVNKLSERIKEIDNLQQDLVSAERTLGNELSKPFVDARKSAQAAFESEAFKKIQSSILELRENSSKASNEELSGLVRPMLKLKEAYVKDRFIAGIAGKSKALEGIVTEIKEQIRGLLLKTPESAVRSLESGSVDLAAEDTLKAASDQAIKDQTRTPYYLVTDAIENRAYLRKISEYRGEEIEQYTFPATDGFDVQTIVPSDYSEERLQRNLIEIDNADNATSELADLMSCQSAHSLASVAIIDTKGLMDTTSRYALALDQRGAVNRLHLERNERGKLERAIACIRTDFSLLPKDPDDETRVPGVASIELYMTFVPHTPDEENLYYFDIEDVDWQVKWIDNPEAHESVGTQES